MTIMLTLACFQINTCTCSRSACCVSIRLEVTAEAEIYLSQVLSGSESTSWWRQRTSRRTATIGRMHFVDKTNVWARLPADPSASCWEIGSHVQRRVGCIGETRRAEQNPSPVGSSNKVEMFHTIQAEVVRNTFDLTNENTEDIEWHKRSRDQASVRHGRHSSVRLPA